MCVYVYIYICIYTIIAIMTTGSSIYNIILHINIINNITYTIITIITTGSFIYNIIL